MSEEDEKNYLNKYKLIKEREKSFKNNDENYDDDDD